MEEWMQHSHRCIAGKFLLAGVVLILVRLFTTWDMWLVIGALAVIKAIMLYMMPGCSCMKKAKGRK